MSIQELKKERPILFSTPMVKAILEGRKTQTRRVIKPQPERGVICKCPGDDKLFSNFEMYKDASKGGWIPIGKTIFCPYGQAGDRLWVRESFGEPFGKGLGIIYRADYDDGNLHKWKPSIHMFRKDSRITLEITKIGVEELMKIDINDIHDEGIRLPEDRVGYWGKLYVDTFHNLWDSINGKKHPWASNPWVWVVAFKIII